LFGGTLSITHIIGHIGISIAKDAVFKAVALMSVEGLPRLIQRRKSDDKARLDVNDVFMLLEAWNE